MNMPDPAAASTVVRAASEIGLTEARRPGLSLLDRQAAHSEDFLHELLRPECIVY
jgi:hypothetical protein